MISETPEHVVADTSCLIILSKIERLEILRDLYGELMIPMEVKKEFGKHLPSWIHAVDPSGNSIDQFSSAGLGRGEEAAFALASELQNTLLIIDDLDARRYADRLQIRHTGTLGVILKAKERGIIQHVRPLVVAIQTTDFRIGRELMHFVLQQANEESESL